MASTESICLTDNRTPIIGVREIAILKKFVIFQPISHKNCTLYGQEDDSIREFKIY